jgi:hypothetical protein
LIQDKQCKSITAPSLESQKSFSIDQMSENQQPQSSSELIRARKKFTHRVIDLISIKQKHHAGSLNSSSKAINQNSF